jgi:1-acyl-sn-glycerol-3-phosphate acyltransferase
MKLFIILRAGFRGVRVASHIVYGMLLAVFFQFLSQINQQRIIKNWSCALLEILNVKLKAHDYLYPEKLPARILVANHISWLDVVALNAIIPASFIAKDELRNWPVLGWLCHRAGTLFVKRNIRRDTLRINSLISGALKQGNCIALFPEGTTSDKELPSHFHSSLLQGAIDVNAALCPVAIRYHNKDGETCFDAAFIGDMNFIQSLWKIMCSPSLHVSIMYLRPIYTEGKNRRSLALAAHECIHNALFSFSLCRSYIVNRTPDQTELEVSLLIQHY